MDKDQDPKKVCKVCGQTKLVETAFYVVKSTGRPMGRCKECEKANQRERYRLARLMEKEAS